MSQEAYVVLAYYRFVSLADPHNEVRRHKDFLKDRNATGRIYLSAQGINGQMSATKEVAQDYMEWMRADPRFADMEFKLHLHHEQAFPKMTVKYRTQLVAFDANVDLSQRGTYVSPSQWRQMLESDEEYLLLDVRNDYEWKIGHFRGATLPPCSSFREFPAFGQELAQSKDPAKTKVMMYCTGGIRCEIYSAYLKQQGFSEVYQLEGGVVKYGLEEGSSHWEGKLFVFDDRLAVPPSEGIQSSIGQCLHCLEATDAYYNCANMDCNELFLCCSACAVKLSGCCSDACTSAPRLRVYRQENGHKPFRKKHLEQLSAS